MKNFKQHLMESASEVSQIIVRVLNRKYPQKISIIQKDNFLTLEFEVRKSVARGALYQKGQLENEEKPLRDKAVKLANSLMKELMKKIRIEDTELSFDPKDPTVSLFMVSDDFVGMSKPQLSLGESTVNERCWDGYKPTPGKKPYEKGSCMKEEDDEIYEESEHDGKKVTLNKPFRTPDGPKKFAVYVKNDKGNVVKVTFGDPNMEIKRDDPERRANYRARHNCSDPGPKWKANYWSCKMWADKPVSKITEEAPPDASIEKWILSNKERFKKEYGEKQGLAILYAKAWDMYNKK